MSEPMTWRQIGTVEVLRPRVYALDPSNDDDSATTVFVEPGTYPLYRNVDAIRWLMHGRLNEHFEKIGDGLFTMHGGDHGSGLEVTFPSKVFGVEQFQELLTEWHIQPGPEQRLRFNLDESLDAA